MRDAPVKTTAFQQGILVTNIHVKERVGTVRILEDGRTFKYAKAGAAISAGTLVRAAATSSNHMGCSITFANNSNTQIEVAISAGTALAADALAGGLLMVTTGALGGRSFRIDSSTEINATDTSITLSLADRIVDFDGTTEVSLTPAACSSVTTAAAGAAVVGAAIVDVASGSYFWVQVKGMANVLAVGAVAVGHILAAGAAGAVATNSGSAITVGNVQGSATVDGEYSQVMLTL